MPNLSPEWQYWCLVNGIPAAVGSILLLFRPSFGRRFAWDIEHRQSAVFIGAGFVMRAGLFWTIFHATAWHQIEWMVWGNVVFAGILLGVTMIWGEQFVWSRPLAALWLFLYIEEPVWMFTLVPEARAAAMTLPLSAGMLGLSPVLRGALALEAVVMVLASARLLFPVRLAALPWPWEPDRVSARMMAGFTLGWAVWAATLALASDWPAARDGLRLNVLWLGTLLAAVVIFHRAFDLRQAATRWFAGILAVLFGTLVILLVQQG